MLGTITNPEKGTMSRPEYIFWRACKHNVEEHVIREAMHICEKGDGSIPDGKPESYFNMVAEICEDISRSGGEVDPEIDDQVHRHTHLVPETPVEAPLVVHQDQQPSGSELAILEAARGTNLANGWDKLKDRFDFGESFDQLADKGPVSPEDLASAMGYGASMTKAGVFVTAKAMLRLQAMGFDAVVTQYASERGLGYSTVSAWLRMESRIPQDSPARKLLHPSAIAEITNARYSSNEEEDKRLREETLREACEMKADTSEARSLVLRVKGEGKEDRPEEPTKKALSGRVKALEAVLHRILANVPASDCPAFLGAVEDARGLFREEVAG